MAYYDKHGKEIRAGMHLRMEDGSVELVYATSDGYGNPDLGVNASNDEYMKRHHIPEVCREYYPLSNFPQDGLEIIEE